MAELNQANIGAMIRDARKQRGLTQAELAKRLETSQSAIGRIESGNQNLSIEMINRIASVLESTLISAGAGGPTHFRIQGPTELSGEISVRSSKNAAVALLCASLLNHGKTTLKNVARIEEVKRLVEVLTSIGVQCTWAKDQTELTLVRPAKLNLNTMDIEAAKRTRSIIMFLGPLLHSEDAFDLPFSGGCDLGTRTVAPHLQALKHFGLDVDTAHGYYSARVSHEAPHKHSFTLIERGDTVTENALMAAATCPEETVIRNASANYMVQDLCFFLTDLGVQIDGIGTTTLRVRGTERIEEDITFSPSEDPIEAMSLITAAIVTGSELTITRSPIEFLDFELAVLGEMGQRYELSDEYFSDNGRTRLTDITIHPSKLHAPADKIHPLPFPGLNIDNLPFFSVIAACATGSTLIHDWVYENRAIHLLDLGKLGARVQLLDPHRLVVQGPTHWHGRELICPPALRPAVCLMLAALAADGTTDLRDVYVINRGYEDLPNRLNALGANIQVFHDPA
ncbi:MAG: UDP-N-acetylglucosamine 1-carboxyvinyltransferase [Propionibacteriaceae bacterium]|jgi:UDP-N-acetylglucosamine 1-carboxyvinyltransferase|nr:UDP-N-acetylglucosamine 1-carboxyvinyltransferase [Propionibacteriaceae bacterium]